MTTDFSLLALDDAFFRRTVVDGNATSRPESHYLDFVVDGQRLGDLVGRSADMTTSLNRAWLSSVEASVQELLGQRAEEGLDPGRVALFVCGECGDLGCGAVTALLQMSEDRVTWSGFAWENGFEPLDLIKNAPDAVTFRAADYQRTLAGAYQRVAAFPYDELAHSPSNERTFLWPWQWGWGFPRSKGEGR